MGRRGITREAVERVYDTLLTAGLTPSVRTVREKLGDTGSLTTIAEHLRAIHLERQDGPGPPLPDPLARKLLEGASSFWRDLSEAADQVVEEIREAATADVAAAHAKRDEAFEQVARAEEELGARRATLDALERHLAQTTTRLERTEAELAASLSAQDAAEERARVRRDERDVLERDLAAAQEEFARRQSQWQNERTTLEARTHALQRTLEDAHATRERERDDLGSRISELETRRAEMATALARAEERGVSLTNALEVRSSECDDARAEVKALRTRLQAALEERDTLSAERAASAREAETATLLERLVDDDRTGRVLALLESIDARVGKADTDNHVRQRGERDGG